MKLTEAKKILELVLTKDLDLSPEEIGRVKRAKKKFIDHYKDNPREFIEDFCQIIHYKTNDSTPFLLNEAQKVVIKEYKEHSWMAVPKARQLGITTLTNALALHHALFTNNAFVVCMAVKNSNAEENLGRIRSMFQTCPKWVQKLLVNWDKDQHFSNKSQWTFKSLIHGTVSTVEVASAASEDGTRGKRVTFAHWTETAFSDVADKVFTSMSPALRRRPDSVVIMESTGNGATGLYYDICMGKKSGFKTVFLPWFHDEDYRKEGTLDEGQLEQVKEFIDGSIDHLDSRQLVWYYETAQEMGKASCQQEYPNSVEQVFLSTNQSFFSVTTVQKVKETDPLYFLSYHDGFFSKASLGPCIVWEKPVAEYEYLISADVSEGVVDNSSFSVFDPKGNEVAHWHGKYDPDTVCEILLHLGRHYNNAWLAIESNGIGQYVLNTMKTRYFYRWIHQYDGKPGVRTSVATKPVMLATLQSMILEDKMVFRNQVLPEEMKTFQADTLKAMKGEGIFDDVVMSAAIGAFMFKMNPPKIKFLRTEYRDYTDNLTTKRKSRQFIIGG